MTISHLILRIPFLSTIITTLATFYLIVKRVIDNSFYCKIYKHLRDKTKIKNDLCENYKTKSIITRDKLKLKYYVLGDGPRCIVFAPGLGARLFKPLSSIINDFGIKRWKYITWDYRGLFHDNENNTPKRIRRLSVPEHAEDLREIMLAECIETADVCLGWSMGTQVLLELTSLYPELVRSLILVNGTHGQVFQTALQPFLRIPFMHRFLHHFIRYLKKHPTVLKNIVRHLWLHKWILSIWIRIYVLLFDTSSIGHNRFEEFLYKYLEDILSSPKHLYAYLSLFEELDSHSTFHLLNEIHNPTLIVCGGLDFLTPAFLSFEMKKEIPNSKLCVYVTSSHVSLLEKSQQCLQDIKEFIAEQNLLASPYVKYSAPCDIADQKFSVTMEELELTNHDNDSNNVNNSDSDNVNNSDSDSYDDIYSNNEQNSSYESDFVHLSDEGKNSDSHPIYDRKNSEEDSWPKHGVSTRRSKLSSSSSSSFDDVKWVWL